MTVEVREFQLRNVLHFYKECRDFFFNFECSRSPGSQSSNSSDLNDVTAHCVMLNRKPVRLAVIPGLSAWFSYFSSSVLFFFFFLITCCIFLWCPLFYVPLRQKGL